MRTSWRPTLGSQPSSTANTHLRMSARKKIGIETPISERKRLAWSIGLPWRLAARNPSGMPMKVAKSIAPIASSIVAGNRSVISSVIGRRDAMLVPRSPEPIVCR